MGAKVTPDNLPNAIAEALAEYSEEATERVFAAVDKVTEEVAAEIEKRIPFTQRTKKYVRAFATRTSFKDKFNKRNTWYVKPPEHRKSHLLEFGHSTRGGGTRTRAFPHIKYGAELAERRLPELCEKALSGG